MLALFLALFLGQNHPLHLLLPPDIKFEDDIIKTLADKHIANDLPKVVLFSRWQTLEILATDITGVNPLSPSCALYPTLIPSSINMNSLTNPPSTLTGSGFSR